MHDEFCPLEIRGKSLFTVCDGVLKQAVYKQWPYSCKKSFTANATTYKAETTLMEQKAIFVEPSGYLPHWLISLYTYIHPLCFNLNHNFVFFWFIFNNLAQYSSHVIRLGLMLKNCYHRSLVKVCRL